MGQSRKCMWNWTSACQAQSRKSLAIMQSREEFGNAGSQGGKEGVRYCQRVWNTAWCGNLLQKVTSKALIRRVTGFNLCERPL